MSDSDIDIENYYSPCIYKTMTDTNEQKAHSVSILVVDDEELMRQSVQELLSLYDLSCTLAADGQEALDLMAENPFDILLLDLIMPNVDGFHVMKEVKIRYPETDIIVTSGEATFKNATLAMRHGVKDFLHKPYIPSEMIKVINNLSYLLNKWRFPVKTI